MEALRLPFAYDSEGKPIYIETVSAKDKGKKYSCPNCREDVILKISRIPEGQKYHRRNHFAHKGNTDNHCSESVLHKLFKDTCTKLIAEKISTQMDLLFEWRCAKCYEKYKESLLKNVASVVTEYDLGKCKPDIALLDSAGKVITVIEVIFTHKPEPEVLKLYQEERILCLQVTIRNSDDYKEVEQILTNSNNTRIFPSRICENCRTLVEDKRAESPIENSVIPTQDVKYILKTYGNKNCEKCNGELQLGETYYGEPCLICVECGAVERASKYDHIIFPNMKRKK